MNIFDLSVFDFERFVILLADKMLYDNETKQERHELPIIAQVQILSTLYQMKIMEIYQEIQTKKVAIYQKHNAEIQNGQVTVSQENKEAFEKDLAEFFVAPVSQFVNPLKYKKIFSQNVPYSLFTMDKEDFIEFLENVKSSGVRLSFQELTLLIQVIYGRGAE